MKHLIAGLGNIGDEYRNTRHNVGFMVLDAAAAASGIIFKDSRYGYVTRMRHKNAELVLLKPSTFMNRSGNAVRYWLKKEKIEIENLLVYRRSGHTHRQHKTQVSGKRRRAQRTDKYQ